jgi:peptidylprolyl isomerase
MKVMKAKKGRKVRVEFVGRLDDGTVFDRATRDEPLEFTVGRGEIIRGLEEVVVKLEPGQSRATTVPAEKAFGPYDFQKVVQIDRDEFPEEVELEPGSHMLFETVEGESLPCKVRVVAGSTVTLDFNHPLAGKDLNFDLKLLEVR